MMNLNCVASEIRKFDFNDNSVDDDARNPSPTEESDGCPLKLIEALVKLRFSRTHRKQNEDD